MIHDDIIMTLFFSIDIAAYPNFSSKYSKQMQLLDISS